MAFYRGIWLMLAAALMMTTFACSTDLLDIPTCTRRALR